MIETAWLRRRGGRSIRGAPLKGAAGRDADRGDAAGGAVCGSAREAPVAADAAGAAGRRSRPWAVSMRIFSASLLAVWPQLGPQLRAATMTTLLKRNERITLLTAVGGGAISPGEVDPYGAADALVASQ